MLSKGRSVVGFNIVAKKNHEASCTQHELTPACQDRELLASVTRQLNSGFSNSGFGKQKLSKVATAITPSTLKRRQELAVTPHASRSSSTSTLRSSSTSTPGTGLLSTPMLDGPPHILFLLTPQDNFFNNDCVVGYHKIHRHSILSPVYKQLTPMEITRLTVGQELIIVLPAIATKMTRMATAAITLYKGLFRRVIAATFNADVDLDEKIKGHHELPRNGSTAHEYCV
jgi:hypothetical protein